MPRLAPDLRRTWLFSPGADSRFHEAMTTCGADALIIDLEDFTPPPLRPKARELLTQLLRPWQAAGLVTTVRINALEGEGPTDLEAAMRAGAEVISYPMAATAAQMVALDAAITQWEAKLGIEAGSTEILPVCETALGVADVRAIAAASLRIRAALLGAEDLANDLCAERSLEGMELEHARRRFLLDCRAAGIEPIDAPYTFSEAAGAAAEAAHARRLGYRSKSLVRTEHAAALNAVFTPSEKELAWAHRLTGEFEAARARGEDRALVDGLWVEVPTYRNAKRLIERGQRLKAAKGS